MKALIYMGQQYLAILLLMKEKFRRTKKKKLGANTVHDPDA